MRKTFLILLLSVLLIDHVSAQFADTWKQDFMAQVKDVDEFLNRFNGYTTHPNIRDSVHARERNILALFDKEPLLAFPDQKACEQFLLSFVDSVMRWGKAMDITDTGVYAELSCEFTIGKATYPANLVLQLETLQDDYMRWGIRSVKGLAQQGVYSDLPITISPVDHDIHFISLYDFFNHNPKLVPNLRTTNHPIDEFSYLAGLFASGHAKLKTIGTMRIHFLQVPGFVFSIEEIGRGGSNSGWLITRIFAADDELKQDFLNQLL